MNAINKLDKMVRTQFPGVKTTVISATNPKASRFLDIEFDGYTLSVEWNPARGFGLTSHSDSCYGEGADELLINFEDARSRVVSLLKARAHTTPPATLKGLRKLRDITQEEIARILHIRQASVAKLENRSDVLLSTIVSVVTAMGGRLIIKVQFPDGMERELNFPNQKQMVKCD